MLLRGLAHEPHSGLAAEPVGRRRKGHPGQCPPTAPAWSLVLWGANVSAQEVPGKLDEEGSRLAWTLTDGNEGQT